MKVGDLVKLNQSIHEFQGIETLGTIVEKCESATYPELFEKYWTGYEGIEKLYSDELELV